MPGLTCNACNKEFNDDTEQKLHYKSNWHRYNLKRKVAGVPGVTEALFLARQSALEKNNETAMLYSCGKEYRSSQAYDQHLKSRSHHIMRGSQGTNQSEEAKVTYKPLHGGVVNKPTAGREANGDESEESEDEWEEVDPEEQLVKVASKSLTALNVDEFASSNNMDTNGEEDREDKEELDPLCCFMCDLEHDSIENCMIHMHKQHGFFIRDVEYLKDPEGLLICLGLKVRIICRVCLFDESSLHFSMAFVVSFSDV
ncbi:hypothetical protein SLE2022_033550 [Rubroshorea leprosula]